MVVSVSMTGSAEGQRPQKRLLASLASTWKNFFLSFESQKTKTFDENRVLDGVTDYFNEEVKNMYFDIEDMIDFLVKKNILSSPLSDEAKFVERYLEMLVKEGFLYKNRTDSTLYSFK